VVHLDENGIGDEGGAAIVTGLRKHGEATSFFYTNNAVGPAFAREFEKLTKKEHGLLTELNFRAIRGDPTSIDSIVTSIGNLTSLTKLILSKVGLSDRSISNLI
jgi:hypothetical protein